ncbi:hypothetical protein, partial [Xanthomonas hortorum]|uniref:hypothetical protein n=1 Tax=Xanthomonas hortorum TaxID=56454 RepID=UPI0020445D4D
MARPAFDMWQALRLLMRTVRMRHRWTTVLRRTDMLLGRHAAIEASELSMHHQRSGAFGGACSS